MPEMLGFDGFALAETGPTLSMSVAKGQSLAIVGPARSGKTELLRTIAGYQRPARGSISRESVFVAADGSSFSKRAKVLAIAKEASATSDLGNEALIATHLAEERNTPVHELSPSQFAACEMIAPLAADAPLALIDGQLDLLSPWCLHDVLAIMRKRSNTTFVVVSNRPDIIATLDTMIVVKGRHIRFAGSPEELIRLKTTHQLSVTTHAHEGVRALVEPFEVTATRTDEGWEFGARDGQELAAKILLEGYGDVKTVILRPPSLAEALRAL